MLIHHGKHVEVRGHFTEVHSHLPQLKLWCSNSHSQAWKQVHLATEQSHWPKCDNFQASNLFTWNLVYAQPYFLYKTKKRERKFLWVHMMMFPTFLCFLRSQIMYTVHFQPLGGKSSLNLKTFCQHPKFCQFPSRQ